MTFFLDRYDRKARLAPAVLVAWPPLTLLLFLGTIPPLTAAVPTLVTAALIYLATDLVRGAGKRTEHRLLAKWGGFPTTLALRHDAPGSAVIRDARRTAVEQISGTTLPTKRRENAHPIDVNAEYEAAVRSSIDAVRTGHPGSELLFNENRNYGFRRNVRALRTVGLAVASASLLASAALGMMLHRLAPTAVACVISMLALLFWISVARDSWVRSQADTYAERFFTTVASASRGSHPPE